MESGKQCGWKTVQASVKQETSEKRRQDQRAQSRSTDHTHLYGAEMWITYRRHPRLLECFHQRCPASSLTYTRVSSSLTTNLPNTRRSTASRQYYWRWSYAGQGMSEGWRIPCTFPRSSSTQAPIPKIVLWPSWHRVPKKRSRSCFAKPSDEEVTYIV
jgi:hypothetical protein